MIKQMRQQGAYIVDIATQIGCSERTVRCYLKYPESPARKTRHKMVKLKPFMDYIDMRLAENGKRPARTVLTGMCYSVGSATRQGSSSLTRFIGQSAMTSRT